MKKVKNPQTALDNLNNTMVDKYLEEKENWYVGSTGNHQGLVISEKDGRNIAVVYDKKDAPLIAAAPEMLEALKLAERSLESLYEADCFDKADKKALRACSDLLSKLHNQI